MTAEELAKAARFAGFLNVDSYTQYMELAKERDAFRATLKHIVDCYDMRTDLYAGADDCAGTLADFARKAISP